MNRLKYLEKQFEESRELHQKLKIKNKDAYGAFTTGATEIEARELEKTFVKYLIKEGVDLNQISFKYYNNTVVVRIVHF